MPQLDPAAPPQAAFAALFRAALAQVAGNVLGVLESADPEYLHQLRVGLRRLRSALRAFGPVLEEPAWLKRSLRRLQPLGVARDWDVFVESLVRARATAPVLRRARRQRDAARRAVRSLVASSEVSTFVLKALRWVESRPPAQKRAGTLARFAAGALGRLERKVLQTRIDDPKSRHALRIRVKRLRYASEFFAPCFPQRAVRRDLARLEALQEILGELNDLAVARRLSQQIDAAVPRALGLRKSELLDALQSAWTQFMRTKTSSVGQTRSS
jgi:CHAD domain-containing protein